MNTSLLIIFAIGMIVMGSSVYLYDQMYDCLNHPMWMKHPRDYGIDDCLQMYYDGTLPDYTIAHENYEEKTFNQSMKQKATDAFEMTLEKYNIKSKQLTVQDGYKWEDEFFMAESITDGVDRYYLMAVFPQSTPADKIDVQIFKIISDECTTRNIVILQGCSPEYVQELKTSHRSTDDWNYLKLVRNNDDLYCNAANDESSDQCHHLEEVVFGNARKDWTVYPGGAGLMPPDNSTLVRIYNEVGFGVPSLNFTAMLNDGIFVEKCKSNGGVWNYTHHDCEALWQVCRDVRGMVVEEGITPPCIDTGIIDDDPLTIKVCHDAEFIRVSCVFEYQN